jgi:hypothetical protein
MSTVDRTVSSVNMKRRPGRPRLRTPTKERDIIRRCVKAAIITGEIPSDVELGRAVGLKDRTVRAVRLDAGLNRWHVAAWIREREKGAVGTPEEDVLCVTPYAGLWLLAPVIIRSVLLPAARVLAWTTKTGVDAWQWILTVVMWAVLGFRRFFHLDDLRHQADLGLALFTGRLRLLADTTVWRLIHTIKPESVDAFYLQTASAAVSLEPPEGEEWISMDEHVVGFFTKLKPPPLGKTRVPTRGRGYPAIRLYAPFHLWSRRFIGLVVTEPRRALSQVLPTLIAEVRCVRKQAGHPSPNQVDVIVDRGAYKGTLFEQLIDDQAVRFIAMARGTQKNVPQWEAVPEDDFTPYHPEGEKNPNLKIADSETRISQCRYPLRTILIRDDTPDTRQRWRALFTNVSSEKMSPDEVDATYRHRQWHESSFAELDHDLSGKCLPKPYRLIRELNDQGERRKTVATTFSTETMTGLKMVAWLRHWSFNLVKDFGKELGDPYAHMHVGTLVRKFIARPGWLRLKDDRLCVTLVPFIGIDALDNWIRHINHQQIAIPWLGNLVLQIEIAQQPVGLAAHPRMVRQRVFANSIPPTVA